MAKLALLGGPRTVTEPTEFIWPPITPADVAAVTALLERGEISYYGREGAVAELEDAFSRRIGPPHALTVTSGTAALHSAFFALGLQPGDEVIAPSLTFLSTVMPLYTVNAVPVLVDSDPDTGNIDPLAIAAAITPRTRAIVVVHLNGHVADMAPIRAIATRHGLAIVEDASHAHGAEHSLGPAGALGDIAAFSLQGAKLVAAGQGGLLLTGNRHLFERAVMFGHFRMRAFEDVQLPELKPFASTGYGLNYRMHPLAAALALSQFARLDGYIDGRNANLARLSALLAAVPGIEPPVVRPYATRHPWYAYKPLYRAEELGGLPRATYLAALKAEGAPVEDSTSLPLHLEPLFQVADDLSITHGRHPNRRRYTDGHCPGAERHAAAALRIPTYTTPQPVLIDQIAEACAKVACHIGNLHDHARATAA